MSTFRIVRNNDTLVEADTFDQLAITDDKGANVLGINIVRGMITLGHWPDGETWEPVAVLGSPDGRWHNMLPELPLRHPRLIPPKRDYVNPPEDDICSCDHTRALHDLPGTGCSHSDCYCTEFEDNQ